MRQVFHAHRIHSVTIQPEFHAVGFQGKAVCEEMCVADCMEAWCCEADDLSVMMVRPEADFALVPVTERRH